LFFIPQAVKMKDERRKMKNERCFIVLACSLMMK